jgi:hypothetical protein
MTTESLALRTARSRVRDYQDQSTDLMKKHAEAMDCRDCEAFLQLGIDAFHWLARADEMIRVNVFTSSQEYAPELDMAIATLYAEWLRPCDHAEAWIARQEERRFRVDNLDEFRRCCSEVRAIVEANEGVLANEAMVELRDQAVDMQVKGETLEFFGNA